MNRKQFILKSTLLAFSVSACANVVKSNTAFVVKDDDCSTTNDILGPFYRENAPRRSDLRIESSKGNQITLKGTVFKSTCGHATDAQTIKDATIEIWHCDENGEYDNTTSKFNHRGQQSSDMDGNYTFNTILPGKYLNGELYRPSHIHFRVTHPDTKELVSQIYFKNDPHITTDPWASKPEANLRILPITLEDTKGNLTIEFNIYLSTKSN